MPVFFDLRTLSLCDAFVGLVVALCMVSVSTSRKTYPGFGRWTIAAVTASGGAVLLSLRAVIPDWLTILTGNAMVIASLGLILDGLRAFSGRRSIGWLHGVTALVFIVPMVVFTFGLNSINARIIAFAVATGIYVAPALWEVIAVIRPQFGRNWLLEISFGLQLLWVLVRLIFPLVNLDGSRPSVSPALSIAVSEALSLATYLAAIIGLLVLNFQRTEAELRVSRTEVSTLRGIIPICASCKRIRDDTGYWNAVEAYVSAHTEAEFSHAICPDCMAKLYPPDS